MTDAEKDAMIEMLMKENKTLAAQNTTLVASVDLLNARLVYTSISRTKLPFLVS